MRLRTDRSVCGGGPAGRRSLATPLLLLLAPLAGAQDAPAGADAPTVETLQDRIDSLEARLDKSPDVGYSDVSVKIFGRVHLDTWNFNNTDDGINVLESGDPDGDPLNSFEFRRARFGMSGNIASNMAYKVEIDFGKPDGLVYKDIYFAFKEVPALRELRIGNQKRPYGLDHLNSSKYNVFIERPYVIEAYNQDARRLGLLAVGVDKTQAWNWRYGIFDMVDTSAVGEEDSDTLQPEVAGRLANTFWWEKDGRNYAHWAVSGTLAFPDSEPAAGDAPSQARFRSRPEARSNSRWIDTGVIPDVDEYHLAGLEGVANFGPTQVVAEWVNSWMLRGSDSQDLVFRGGYIYVAHFLTGEHMPWNRKSGTLGRIKPNGNLGEGSSGAWQVAARYSYADFTDGDVYGGVANSLTLGLNWYWNAYAGMQLNAIQGHVSGRQVAVGPDIYSGGDYTVVGLRFRVEF